jgi:hypothetical protein
VVPLSARFFSFALELGVGLGVVGFRVRVNISEEVSRQMMAYPAIFVDAFLQDRQG